MESQGIQRSAKVSAMKAIGKETNRIKTKEISVNNILHDTSTLLWWGVDPSLTTLLHVQVPPVEVAHSARVRQVLRKTTKKKKTNTTIEFVFFIYDDTTTFTQSWERQRCVQVVHTQFLAFVSPEVHINVSIVVLIKSVNKRKLVWWRGYGCERLATHASRHGSGRAERRSTKQKDQGTCMCCRSEDEFVLFVVSISLQTTRGYAPHCMCS